MCVRTITVASGGVGGAAVAFTESMTSVSEPGREGKVKSGEAYEDEDEEEGQKGGRIREKAEERKEKDEEYQEQEQQYNRRYKMMAEEDEE